MHKSRFVQLVIDCQGKDIDAAARFWSAALGRKVLPASDEFPLYRELEDRPGHPLVLIQAGVGHESRIHLDIETDDQDAEVARLEKLGARRLEFRKRWWIMEAPTGQRFCVVRPQRGALGDDANRWDDPSRGE